MSSNIIISFDGSDNDHDALALGRSLAGSDSKVSLAYVRHSQESDAARETQAQNDAESVLERGAQYLGDSSIERHVVVNASTGEGLRSLAAAENADVVVFGSDWHTTPGHVQPGAGRREQRSAMSWFIPARTTIRSTEKSWRFSGKL
jgi:nucleotide-binding universal stress UspA family protein